MTVYPGGAGCTTWARVLHPTLPCPGYTATHRVTTVRLRHPGAGVHQEEYLDPVTHQREDNLGPVTHQRKDNLGPL